MVRHGSQCRLSRGRVGYLFFVPCLGCWCHITFGSVFPRQEHLVVESVRRYLELPRSTARRPDNESKSGRETLKLQGCG